MLVLKTILSLTGNFKADHISNVMAGKLTSSIKLYKHHQSEVFGIGKDKDERFWNTVIRQALIEKLIDKDIESYGLLSVTQKGKEYIKKPYSFNI